ncbi:MAG TPA: hypothetical protein VGM10_08050 [Actinocrinis sp.]|jgi:hypothetical protein
MAGWRSVIVVLAGWLASSALLVVFAPGVAMPVSVVILAAGAIFSAMRENPTLATSDNRMQAAAEEEARAAAAMDQPAGCDAAPGADQQPHSVRAEDQIGPQRR